MIFRRFSFVRSRIGILALLLASPFNSYSVREYINIVFSEDSAGNYNKV